MSFSAMAERKLLLCQIKALSDQSTPRISCFSEICLMHYRGEQTSNGAILVQEHIFMDLYIIALQQREKL